VPLQARSSHANPRKEITAMLFHVTMTHTADNCPAYHSELVPEFIASMEKLDELGEKLNVKAHSVLWGAPDHVAFAVLEADSLRAIAGFLNSIAIAQDFDITPVQQVSDVVEFARALRE
jgi:hypothetical protein